MDITIKSSVIKRLRAERRWSQEHLAKAAGLGLRTIQRLEAQGSASMETVQALAAVFNVDYESLVWAQGGFNHYRHRQWASPLLLSAFLLIPLFDTLFQYLGVAASERYITLTAVVLVLVSVAIFFSSMTIEVNDLDVRWHFAFKQLAKSIPLTEIKSVEKVKNPWWMGLGIHSFGTGWIYNVSGLWGVEIELNSGELIRLGTNQPNYLKQAIRDGLDNIST
jgi:transcriptional regulator with XRE-family HTH domain